MPTKLKETEAMRRARMARGRAPADPSETAQRYITVSGGQYSVEFPRHFGTISKSPVLLRTLEAFPGIAEAFAHGYTLHGLSVASANRRYYIWQGIKSGFLKFLALRDRCEVRLDQIDEAMLKEFKAWLDDPSSAGFSDRKITRRTKIQELQLVLQQLMKSPKWSPRLSPNLKLLENPYPKASREVEHTEILDDAALEVLYVAAVSDCEEIMERWRTNVAHLAAVRQHAITLDQAGQDAFHCAAFMLSNFEEPFPPRWKLIRMRVQYDRSVPAATYAAMQQLLYPDLDELLPFILLLAVMFAFNPGVVLNMTHSDYEEEQLFGRERIRLKPFKPRAHRNQVSTVLATDDADNPRTIFRHLKDRCARVRTLVDSNYSNHVFLRFSAERNCGIAVTMSDKPMREAIARFCSRHGLDTFQLRQIRPTTLDLVHEISGGNLLAMQQVANHQDPETTMEYYTGSAFQRRGEEMLAAGMEHLTRKVRTGGAVDPTTRHRLHADLAAATPGFACLDPMDSPMPGERKGALCGAYGRCPICPLAIIDPQSAQAFAYLLKLREALDEAAPRLGAAWLARWAPVKQQVLTRWAPLFSDEKIRRRGAEMAELAMPNLPSLD
jgi:integrase